VTRATLVRIIAAIAVLTVVMAVPMTQIHWNGTEASAQADDIDTLLNVMIILSSFVFAIVLVMLGYCVWKYRAKPGDESDGEPIHGNTKLEIAWTVIPTVIVLFGAGYSWIVLDDIESKEPDAMPVTVIGQQFKWSFEYPDRPVGTGESSAPLTTSQLHVPVDRQIEVTMVALDVLHSFWVPEWGIKRDAVPAGDPSEEGVDDKFVVTPNEEGTYSLICTELCGTGHATMRATVVVESQEEFDQWISDQEQAQGGAATQSSASASG
jgi:cytochrome c oxidase subunit II